MDIVLKILDKEYVRDSYVKTDVAQARYEWCRRMPGQTMEEYFRKTRVAKSLLERADPGTTISGVSVARKLLRRSGRTVFEQRGVLAAAGATWDPEKIEDVLTLMYGDAHRNGKKCMGGDQRLKFFKFGSCKNQPKGKPHSTFHGSAAEAEECVEDDGSPEVSYGSHQRRRRRFST